MATKAREFRFDDFGNDTRGHLSSFDDFNDVTDCLPSYPCLCSRMNYAHLLFAFLYKRIRLTAVRYDITTLMLHEGVCGRLNYEFSVSRGYSVHEYEGLGRGSLRTRVSLEAVVAVSFPFSFVLPSAFERVSRRR